MTEGKENGECLSGRVSRSDELQALAARIEHAEPDRYFDILIAETAFVLETRPYQAGKRKLWWFERGTDKVKFYGEESIPHYTTSLDAAVTLVPEGQWGGNIMWNFGDLPKGGFVELNCGPVTDDGEHVACVSCYSDQDAREEMPTARPLAMAICAAALRARAAVTKAEGNAPEVAGSSTEREI